jgi:hypothetical protein
MGRKSFSLGVLAFLLASLLVFLGAALGFPPVKAAAAAESDRYTARTEDGVDLALKRYRPGSDARFRKGGQPVIIMPGIISNFNEFDLYTPEGENYDLKLPSPLAAWARNDRYVKRDPMRYYSLAHYLWNQGYDVWLANYRGEGREPYLSGGAAGYSVDDCGIYDLPAIVEKVYEVTGRHPVYCGHSMGASMCIIYLNGAKYSAGPKSHVISDPALVAERNGGSGKQALKGFIDLDGPMGTAGGPSLDMSWWWDLFYTPWYIDMRWFIPFLSDFFVPLMHNSSALLWFAYEFMGWPDLGPLNTLTAINPNNIDENVYRYLGKYGVDGTSTRTFAQLQDAHVHRKFREDYTNGNPDLPSSDPPDPFPGDGYYYYSDNLGKISLPALVLADDTPDLTTPQDIQNFYAGKTRNSLDKFMRVPGTAHIDLVVGLNAPTVTFPEIGRWLQALSKRG